MDKILISVIGGHNADAATAKLAEETGAMIAGLGAVLVCGGLTGVMEYAAKGAKKTGGTTVGILPGDDKHAANKHIDIPIATGLGYTRNTIVAGCADIIVALPGKEGTLSEIAFGLTAKKPVLAWKTWDVPGVIRVGSVRELERNLRQLLKNDGHGKNIRKNTAPDRAG